MRLTLLILLVSINFNAFSCECRQRGTISAEDYNNASLIFYGRFVGIISKSGNNITYQFHVSKWYKGSKQEYAEVSTFNSGAMCGIESLDTNTQYLIYAYKNDKGILGTSRCSRTTFVPKHQWPRDAAIIKEQQSLERFGEIIYNNKPSNFHADTLFLSQHLKRVSQKHYHYKYTTTDGSILIEGNYKNGLPDGEWIYAHYEDDPDLGKSSNETVGNYVNGLKEGEWKTVKKGDGKEFGGPYRNIQVDVYVNNQFIRSYDIE